LRGDAVGELVQIRLADVGIARRLEPLDRGCRLRGNVIDEDRRAVRRREPRRVEQILDGQRDAGARRLRARQKDPIECRHAATLGDSSYLLRFGLGFFGVCTSTRRVTVAPLLPPRETLVSCRMFETLLVRSALKSCLGRTKRMSLLPLRS